MCSWHLPQCRASGSGARYTSVPQAIELLCNLRRRVIKRVMPEFEMTEWQSKRTGNRIIAHPGVRHLGPAARGQTNVWPMQVGQERAVSTGVPAEKIQETSNRFGA